MYKIIRKEKLNDVVELMEIHAPFVARKCEPGQFIILRVGEDGERIPLTIADFDREKETITIIYQIVGYSTQQLSNLNEGDELTDFVGPLCCWCCRWGRKCTTISTIESFGRNGC